ncbi:peptidyl-tRNA hydrolase [Sarracenia purpurea var. burkii]
MAAIRTTTKMINRDIIRPSLFFEPVRMFRTSLPSLGASIRLKCRGISYLPCPCAASDSGDGGAKKSPSRLSQIQQLMRKRRRELLLPATNLSPQITLGSFKTESHDSLFFTVKTCTRILRHI